MIITRSIFNEIYEVLKDSDKLLVDDYPYKIDCGIKFRCVKSIEAVKVKADLANINFVEGKYASYLIEDDITILSETPWELANTDEDDNNKAFYRIGARSLSLENVDTSKVEVLDELFADCSIGELELGEFNTSCLKSMRYAFKGAIVDSMDLSRINFENVDLYGAFDIFYCDDIKFPVFKSKVHYTDDGNKYTLLENTFNGMACGNSSLTIKGSIYGHGGFPNKNTLEGGKLKRLELLEDDEYVFDMDCISSTKELFDSFLNVSDGVYMCESIYNKIKDGFDEWNENIGTYYTNIKLIKCENGMYKFDMRTQLDNLLSAIYWHKESNKKLTEIKFMFERDEESDIYGENDLAHERVTSHFTERIAFKENGKCLYLISTRPWAETVDIVYYDTSTSNWREHLKQEVRTGTFEYKYKTYETKDTLPIDVVIKAYEIKDVISNTRVGDYTLITRDLVKEMSSIIKDHWMEWNEYRVEFTNDEWDSTEYTGYKFRQVESIERVMAECDLNNKEYYRGNHCVYIVEIADTYTGYVNLVALSEYPWKLNDCEPDLNKAIFKNVITRYLSLENVDTSETRCMDYLFNGARIKKLELGEFNTSKLDSMDGIFKGATIVETDLSKLKLNNISLREAFKGFEGVNTKLPEINISPWYEDYIADTFKNMKCKKGKLQIEWNTITLDFIKSLSDAEIGTLKIIGNKCEALSEQDVTDILNCLLDVRGTIYLSENIYDSIKDIITKWLDRLKNTWLDVKFVKHTRYKVYMLEVKAKFNCDTKLKEALIKVNKLYKIDKFAFKFIKRTDREAIVYGGWKMVNGMENNLVLQIWDESTILFSFKYIKKNKNTVYLYSTLPWIKTIELSSGTYNEGDEISLELLV